jgi:hypothetical protein
MSNTEERIAHVFSQFFKNDAYGKPTNYTPKDPRYYEFQLEEKAVAVDDSIYGLVLRLKLTFNPSSNSSIYPMFDATFKIAPYLAPIEDIRAKEWTDLIDDDSLLNQPDVQEKMVAALKNSKSGIFAGIAACPEWLNGMAEIDPKMRDLVRAALAPKTPSISKPTPPAL